MIGTNSMSLFLFFSSISSFLYSSASLTLCRPDQRDALLEFKSEFELGNPPEFLDELLHDYLVPVNVTSYPKTKSWANNSDCCQWDGITCDANSGMVTGVDLSYSSLHGHFKLNSSLFVLRQLRNLNLAYNDFNASPIPSGFNKLMGLERLNLSHSWFSGQIPPEILHLTKLVSLDLSSCFNLSQSRPLFIDKPFLGQLAQNLTNLRHLDMSYVNISSEIPQMIPNLTSLRSICLHKCHLFGKLPLSFLRSPIIQSIDLSMNPYLESSLPEFNGSNSLVYLDLSETSLSGNIPNSIGNLKHFNVLRFDNCNLTGKIPFSIGNLSLLNTLHLSSNNFDALAFNHFTGALPPNITSLSNLKYFDASLNSFVGSIPSTLFTIPSLETIFLNNNQLSGPLEIGNISSMSKLQELDLSRNDLTGPIPRSISKFVNLRSLSVLSLGSNHLGGKLPDIFLNGSNLRSLNVGHNQLVHKLPRSLSDCSSLEVLNMEHNRINDTFPFWLKSLPKLQVLVLHSNEFYGSLQYQPKAATWFPQLRIMDVSHNAFTGALPSDFFMYWMLSRDELHQDPYTLNKLSGQIPHSLAGLTSLSTVRVSHNKLVGMIPQSTQFQTQRVSGFCGAPLDECGVVGHDDPPLEEEEEEQVLSWIAAAIGFAPGVVIGLTIAFPQIALVVRRQ
ncbi:hypothetical protein BRARA_C03863 [Brassica rapa]|uniref:Uncharacterized protein n=1 Tax=Brassica campestris TaxID=3711 RepID=A0A398A2E2_BRACM|nr:hypothetical protein BRARA_C03863 [Brassica rapa]